MKHIKAVRGDTLNIAVTNIVVELDDGSFYTFTETDRFTFAIGLPHKKPILQKERPGEMQLVGDTLLVSFSPEETLSLQSLSYEFDCKLDFGGEGTNVYTIVHGELQMFETVAKMGGGG